MHKHVGDEKFSKMTGQKLHRIAQKLLCVVEIVKNPDNNWTFNCIYSLPLYSSESHVSCPLE